MSEITIHEDGLYFGMPASEYLADPALGSSDLKALLGEPAVYWFNSHLNPNRPERETTPAQEIGEAVHLHVLLGEAAFAAAFAREPDAAGMLITDAQIAEFLRELGEEKLPRTKAEKIDLALRLRPTAPIYDVRLAEAAEGGRRVLKGETYDRIVTAATMIEANPELSQSFQGGYPEVSLFWTEERDGIPIRRKARFDYLKPRAIVDLKSVRPTQPSWPFAKTCYRALAEWHYPMQAAAYMHAREQLPRLVAAGKVFGEVDPVWLAKVATTAEYAFVFVFWASVGAPLNWACSLSPNNPVLEIAEAQVGLALSNYVNALRRFGTEQAWITPEPLVEVDGGSMPGWWGMS